MNTTRRQLLSLLSTQDAQSGQVLGQRLGISRAAVWKHVRALEAQGVPIESSPSQGYRLGRSVDLLDDHAIRKALRDAPVEELEILESVDSTNTELLRRARKGGIHRQVLLAEYQSHGRGRRGRRWESGLGEGLCLSLGWQFEFGVDRLQGLSLVLGVAATEALADCDVRGVGLKWPNDLLLNGAKLGGILVEIRGEFDGPCQVVAGIGLNVHAGGDQPDRADLSGHGLSRSLLAGRLIDRWFRALIAFPRDGLSAWLPRLAAMDVLAGHPIRVQQGDQWVHGLAAGIDEQGRLLLDREGDLQAVAGGEVSVRYDNTAD